MPMNSQGEELGELILQSRHLELEIKTLQNVPRVADELRQFLKIRKKNKK
jgi:hypothetical protein